MRSLSLHPLRKLFKENMEFQKGDRVKLINQRTREVSRNEGIFEEYLDSEWCRVCWSYGSFNVNLIKEIFKVN